MVKKIGPILVILILVFVFFWKVFLKNLIPIPADIIVGMYYPWLDYKWGYEVGVPVKNPLLSDAISQFWIWRNLAIDLLKKGQNPLWNPYSLCGSPLVPIFHSSLFSPFNLLFFLFDKLKAMSLIVIFQPLLSLFFMYFFLRELKLSCLSSLFGSIVFGFSGFMLAWLEWGNIGHTLLWLPFFLWLTEKLKRTKKEIYLMILIIALGISLSAGHPQTFFYCFCVWFCYFIWTNWERIKWKSFCAATVITGVFILCFAFLIIPAGYSFLSSIRPVENYISRENYGFFPPLHIITFLAPDFFGNPATGNWWGKGFNYQEQIGYFGLLPLGLVLFCFYLNEKKENRVLFWKILFLVSFLLALKYPLSWLIYFLKIPLLSTASASRILMINTFSGAVLAAFGLEKITKENIKIFCQTFLLPTLVILSYGLAAIISYFLAKREIKVDIYSDQAINGFNLFANQMKVGLRNLVLPILLLFLLYCLTAGSAFFKKNKRSLNFFRMAIVLLTIGELFRFGWKYNPFVKKEFYFPQTSITQYLQKEMGLARLEREKAEVLPPNMWIPFDLYSASGYDPVYPLSYAKFLSIFSKTDGNFSPSRYAEIDTYSSFLFNLSGIKYVLAIKRNKLGVVDQRGDISYKFNLPQFEKVYEKGSLVVLKNKEAFPRLFWAKTLFFSKDDESATQKILENISNLKETAILTVNNHESFKLANQRWQNNNEQNKISIETYQSGMVVLDVETKSDGFLVMTDTFFPGWEAFIDGVKTKIYKVDIAFRGIEIPSGKHKVIFKYRPFLLKESSVISCFSFLMVIFLTVTKLPRKIYT